MMATFSPDESGRESRRACGQRLDVAKTIYYRRRKGTGRATLEEIANDITGWDARVVEFFRRLSRTRHNFDPPLVDSTASPADDQTLQLAEGLLGNWTRTLISAGGLTFAMHMAASRAQSLSLAIWKTATSPSVCLR